MRQELHDGDLAFPVSLEARHVLGYAVGERERSLLGQDPDRGCGDHLGVGVQQPGKVSRCPPNSRVAARCPSATRVA
jgi:hypothetical protein